MIKHSRETEEERNLGPVPTLSYVQNGGPVDFASIISMPWPRLLLYLATQVFCFTIELS